MKADSTANTRLGTGSLVCSRGFVLLSSIAKPRKRQEEAGRSPTVAVRWRGLGVPLHVVLGLKRASHQSSRARLLGAAGADHRGGWADPNWFQSLLHDSQPCTERLGVS